MTNIFEQAARDKKVRQLVAHFDSWVREATLNPHRDAAAVAEALMNMKAQSWAQHAIVCGVRPPSAETIAAVVVVYRERARNQGDASVLAPVKAQVARVAS